jgi:hypothetical protein
MSNKFYFVCRSNPSAPALVLDHFWEAREMFNNTEYFEVDENGMPVVRREDAAPTQIPMQVRAPKK